ncbi:MAG: tetratricopeptide repeat protein, partial [Alistipes sp.]|nr:tetratricopeptide repeat protein [Alistipes sp.]
MKKMILSAFAALLLAVPAVQAQKVNKSAILAKIEKSDADIADAKKAAKAATWINRGKAFYEAATTPTKDLYGGMESVVLTLFGNPKSKGTETIGNVTYETWVYPYFTAYFQNGKLFAWKETSKVYKNSVEKAFEAYSKAYELDPKSASKVKEGLTQLINYCKQLGDVNYATHNFAEAGKAFAQAYEMETHPAYNNPEPILLYSAGVSMTVDGSEHPASFKKGAEYLERAIDAGYSDEEGRIYYYLFHCYYGQREENPDMLIKSKDALLAGIAKYPKNDLILQGLMQLYTSEKNVGDPADLVSLIDNAIADDPTNIDLWFGRGRIFYALKNFDESIASFQKVTEIKPDYFEGQFYLGLFYIFKGDDANQKFNETMPTNMAEYDEALKAVNAIYMEAVAPLEKAPELKPNDP